MTKLTNEIEALFSEAKARVEFEFVLTLINFKGMGSRRYVTNLHEWFDAIELYKKLYWSLEGFEKVRIGLHLYSTFFENTDFYNILGSFCKIRNGYKGSPYLIHLTRKQDRLLGTGEKINLILELLADADKEAIIEFFEDVHHKQIRNTYYHSSYSLEDDTYILHDSEPVDLNGSLKSHLSISEFIIPRIDKVIIFFDTFKSLYQNSFMSYTSNVDVYAQFPEPCTATIIGSETGLIGFKIRDAVEFFGKKHDSGIEFDEKYDMWKGLNIVMSFDDKATIELQDQIKRYSNKDSIRLSDAEFQNMIDVIIERGIAEELASALNLLYKFGENKYNKTTEEQNPYKRASLAKITMPYYQKILEIGKDLIGAEDREKVSVKLKNLEELSEQ